MPSAQTSLIDIVRWAHATEQLPPQGDVHSTFGDPPLRVFQGERFQIDVLFWVDGTTSIHQHGFSGAFHVLAGSSIHSRYSFDCDHRYNDLLSIGRLSFENVELLRAGDTRPILSGSQTIHSLFHLERPSVSVVVRTPFDPHAGPQLTYDRGGVAYEPFYKPDSLVKQSQTLRLLHSIGHPSLEEIARSTIRSSDAFSAFHLFSVMMQLVDSEERFRAFVDDVRPIHDSLCDRMLKAYSERLREGNIVRRRRVIRKQEHRFLMALLLNVPTRESILKLVRDAYPTAPPETTIVQWVEELSRLPFEREPNALGVELDDSSLAVFRELVDGATNDEVVNRLRERYGDAEVDHQRDELVELCEAFRGSHLFGRLLTV